MNGATAQVSGLQGKTELDCPIMDIHVRQEAF